jgi:hypothetical protein
MKSNSEWPQSTKPFLTNPPEGTAGIVLPIRDNLKFFKLALHSILDFTDYRYMLTVVDNMSCFATRQYLESIRRNHPVNVLQYQQPHSQGAEWNLGLRFMFAFANVHYGIVLTPDVVVEPNWLSRLIKTFNQGADTDIVLPKSNDIALGFCAAFKRPVYERLHGFDEVFHDAGPTSADFLDRARKACLRLFWSTEVYVHHFNRAGLRSDPELLSQDRAYLKAKESQVPA